jgi:hypothetical protein
MFYQKEVIVEKKVYILFKQLIIDMIDNRVKNLGIIVFLLKKLHRILGII